jgi:tRNA-2-methylthio-N6-dimethylallyladenosine synthase
MNVHDSEQLAELLVRQGFRPVRDAKRADLIIVNTCSIREKAEQKAISEAGKLRNLKQSKPGLMLGIGGCMAQKEGRGLLKKLSGLDFVFGTQAICRVPEIIRKVQQGAESIVDTGLNGNAESIGILAVPAQKTSAFVSIMQGCDNFCAFCVVPYLRGSEISRDMPSVLDEIRSMAASGVREVTLLGQNVNSYGKSLGRDGGFSALLRQTGRIEGIERVRFTTSHPKDFTEDIMFCFAQIENLCEHIHLPVQSGSDRILEMMNRRYTAGDYLGKVERLREICPGISITTDIIVGFPGETEDDFEKTLALMREVRFDGAFSFKYSDRTGTAAEKLDGKISDSVKGRRLKVLQALQESHTLERNRELEGTVQQVIVEGASKNSGSDMMGRTRTNRIVNFPAEPHLIGSTVSVRITAAYLHSLRGEMLSEREVFPCCCR